MFFRRNKIIFLTLALTVIFTFSSQGIAFAGRSGAGGGKLAKFDTGKFALGAGIALGSVIIGSAIGSGINVAANGGSFTSAFSAGLTPFGKYGALAIPVYTSAGRYIPVSTLMGTLATFTVANNISFATGQMGRAFDLDPRANLLVSSIAGGALTGALNPGSVLGGGFDPKFYTLNCIANGALLGAVKGGVTGGILAAAANKKGEVPFWAGPLAGLAGSLTSSFIVGAFSPYDFKGGFDTHEFSFGNLGGRYTLPDAMYKGLTNAGNTLVYSIPTTALHIGVNAMTQKMEPQSKEMVQNAFSGLDYIVNPVWSNYVVGPAAQAITAAAGKTSPERVPAAPPPTTPHIYHNPLSATEGLGGYQTSIEISDNFKRYLSPQSSSYRQESPSQAIFNHDFHS